MPKLTKACVRNLLVPEGAMDAQALDDGCPGL
jgi:hypothetical protein